MQDPAAGDGQSVRVVPYRPTDTGLLAKDMFPVKKLQPWNTMYLAFPKLLLTDSSWGNTQTVVFELLLSGLVRKTCAVRREVLRNS